MTQAAVDEWRMPFTVALPRIHRNLVRMFADARHTTLVGRDQAAADDDDGHVRTYDADDDDERRRFFVERLRTNYDDVATGHIECETAALERLVVAAVDHDERRLQVALVVNWRRRAGRETRARNVSGMRRDQLDVAIALAQRHWRALRPGDDYRLHLVAIVWQAASSVRSDGLRRLRAAVAATPTTTTVEVFASRELLIDPLRHDLQPLAMRRYVPASADDARQTLDDYDRLRRFAAADPSWRRLGLPPGAVVECRRTDPRLGTARVLRVGDLEGATAADRRREHARIRRVASTEA